MSPKSMRYVALAIAAAWACWWVIFSTAEAIGTGQFGEAIVMFVATFGALAVAWKWPVIGGMLWLLEGAASIALWAPMWLRRFPPIQIVILAAIMPAPPIAAGFLLLLWRRRFVVRVS
jgi:hypothetical protein